MDDPAVDPVEHKLALQGLRRLNRCSGSGGVLWPAIREVWRDLRRPVRVLDVATGSGDIPAALLARAKRKRIPLEVAGCDISATAIAAASRQCPEGRFFVCDALRDPLPRGYDVVACSLFLHHLSIEDAVLLLQRMRETCDLCVLVNDLSRSRFNYLTVKLACHLLTRSRIVHFDGPASVRSAFTPGEALILAEKAGLHGATVRNRFPCRFLLSWWKGSSGTGQ